MVKRRQFVALIALNHLLVLFNDTLMLILPWKQWSEYEDKFVFL